MPLQNRVTPLGELVADPGRGLVFGNRGCLHDDARRIRRRFSGKRWIACRLEFRGRHRGALMQPGRYTELFFLDEATALAAGHRPCAECRRDDYNRFVDCWQELHPGQTRADALDVQLHAEREPRRPHAAPFTSLPDGGYDRAVPRPAVGTAAVITPPSLVSVLRAGWQSSLPLIHPSAGG